MTRSYPTRFTIVLAFLLFAATAGESRAQITPEEVASLEHVGQVLMHDQGNHVVYTLRKPRSAEDEIGGDYQELHVLDIRTGESGQLIAAPQSVSSVSWVPDSRRIAFRMTDTDHHDRPQVYSLDIVDGGLQKHTSAPEGVMAYSFSDDPSILAYTMRSPWPREVRERREQGFDMDVYGEDERHVRLWIQENGEAQAATPDNMTVWDFEWAPDRRHLAVRTTHGTGIDDEMMFSEILVLDREDGSLDMLAESQGKVGPLRWSPNGRQFAFLAAKALNDPLPQRLYVLDVGDYTPIDITPENYEGTIEWLAWKDDVTLRFVAVEGTRTTLREIPASGGHAVLLAGDGLEVFRSVSFDSSGETFAASVHRRDHPSEVYLHTLDGTGWERLTRHNSFLDNLTLGRQETITWEGPDGLLIEGVLTYPVGYEDGESYPLAILPHGGPEGVSLDGWNTRPLYPAQVLASHGYVVLKPNYRGSGGRGSAFTMANHRDLGGKEFEDVIRGIDHLAYDGVVNPRKVGISGTSYGGYFSAWAGTRYSDRFAAAITFAGLSNWISFMGTTDIPHEMSITHWDLWWFENHGLNWDRSPIAHLQNANTPILVAHGMADDRVHPEQSIQLHQFLRLNDIPTGLVMYPRQPHGLVERAHRIDFMERVVDWFDRYVKGDGTIR
ncbi:S9 family peptidase [Balneolales bacterium ANBcel1]|nr:S9 family peptidase [Balneolales bacterium ANBcel1]